MKNTQHKNQTRSNPKRFIPIFIFILIFGMAAYGIFHLYISGRHIPATAEQVETALSNQGFQPKDITDSAQVNFPGMGLENCIVAEQNDIRFEFYRFDNVGSARKVYQQAYTKIIGKRTTYRVEVKEGKLNYHVYILDMPDGFYLAQYTENTAVYAYCASENSEKINSVLGSLGYTHITGNDWNANSPFDGIARVAAYAIWIPVMFIVRFWIWPVVCKSAGVTRSEALELGDSRKKIIPKLIRISKSPKRTKMFATIHNYIALPAYIAVIIAVGSCFTDKLNGVLGVFGIAIPIIMVCCAVIFSFINRVIYGSGKRS